MFNKIYDKIKKFILENYINLIIIAITVFVGFYQFPYVIHTPGGIVSLEKRIVVDGGYNYEGSLNTCYVTQRNGSILNILLSYVMPNWDLLKKEDVVYDGETLDDLLKTSKIQMESSLSNAKIVAYNKAGLDINITGVNNYIIYIDKNADTNLKLFDKVVSAEGLTINSIDDLKDVVSKKGEGSKISLKVIRDKKEIDCYANVYLINDLLKIGVGFITTYETDDDIEIKVKGNESGSSGGMMLSLAIYNKLVKEDITYGKKIVGTGTIDVDGNVGAIDGVKYKLLGADKNNIDLFLCPKENYEEALQVKNEFNLKTDIALVETFDDALNILKEKFSN